MPLQSLRRLALADLTPETLRRLIEHGEDLLVEHKRELPDAVKLGATVASFANTVGGWLLIGVADDRTLAGYSPPPKLDLQSHVGQLLRNALDPAPPFVAGTRTVDDTPIAVIRVFESDDVPVIVKATGAVYVRDAGGKRPVGDHRTLLALTQRGESARERAEARLVQQPLVNDALSPPDAGGVVNWLAARPAHRIRTVVRIAPLTVTPQLADWPMSRLAAEECAGAAAKLVVGDGPGGDKLKPVSIHPHGRGVVATADLSRSSFERETATVAADSSGVVGAAVTRARKLTTIVKLDDVVGEEIAPILRRLATMLNLAEAYGGAVCDLWLLVPAEANVYGAPRRAPLMHVSGEIVIPAGDAEVTALADQWQRELERTVGMASFEADSAT